MNKKFIFLFILLILLLPNGVYAASKNSICVDGNEYNVTSLGKNVNSKQIESENIQRESMLPQSYFTMKKELLSRGITTNQIDTYLSNPNSNDFQSGSTNFFVKDFAEKYKSTYQKYSDVLKNKTESDYAFKTVSLNRKCNRKLNPDGSYDVLNCPTLEQSSENGKYSIDKIKRAISELKFDGHGKFKFEMKDLFDRTLLIRIVVDGQPNNVEQYDYDSLRNLGKIGKHDKIVELKSESYEMVLEKGQEVRMEFYINPTSGVTCSGAYLAYTSFMAPDYANVENKYRDTKICQDFKNGYSNIPTMPTNYKELFVPECYKNELEYFTEINKINENTIQDNIKKVNSFFQTETADISKLQCHYGGDGAPQEWAKQTKTFIYNPPYENSYGGDYWAASCTETVEVFFDRPKKVIAGAGFDYKATLKVTRTCVPVVISKVPNLPKCQYNIECWGGPANHSGQNGAGPNEEFDQCVQSCDGGKYTKNCINSCYKSVYEKTVDRTFSFLDVVKKQQTIIKKDSKYSTTATSNTLVDCKTKKPDSPNYCYNKKGNEDWWYGKEVGKYQKTPLGSLIYELAASSNNQANCDHWRSCTSFHGITFTYLDTCNSTTNPTKCYEVYSTRPRPYCTDSENESGNAEEVARDEYNDLIDKIKIYESNEDVSMSVIDSYLTENGNKNKLLKTTWEEDVKFEPGDKVDPEIKENVRIENYKENGNPSGNVSVPSVKVTKSYTANLPQAYLDKITGEYKHVGKNYTASQSEIDAGNKYYTDINSRKYNDFRHWDNGYAPKKINYDPSNREGNNIGVTFTNIGTEQTDGKGYTWKSIDIDCFYGLFNEHHIECDDNVCDVPCLDRDNDVCTAGLQYMFRQVNLTDLFPNRSPRWNWNYQTTVGSYKSDAKAIIEQIEKEGNNAYNHQPEYEFVITKGNINKIRSYNNKAGSYQDYPDMSCSTNGSGTKVCKSGFMDNTTYIKSFVRNTNLGQNTNRNG